MTVTDSIVSKAEGLSGYDSIDGLRQRVDNNGILSWAPQDSRSILDLGCGTGSLLAAAVDQLPELEFVAGIDLLPDRITEALSKLAGFAGKTRLLSGDLTDPPDLGTSFDVVTMTAVLHWLYPHEEKVFGWVARYLAPQGTFLLTTYHPARNTQGLGGTDSVVAEALNLLGAGHDEVSERFTAAGLAPIAERTRSADAIEDLLQRYLNVGGTDEQSAVMRVRDGQEYQRYHAATFGTYYSQVAESGSRQDFFEALGRVAETRMSTLGYVTSMPIRRWRCEPKS